MQKTLLVFFVLGAGYAGAQPVVAGIKLGAPFTDVFDVQALPTASPLVPFSADARRFIVGPYVELRLPFRMAIEVDALYRTFEFRTANISSSTNSWEFPVILKHKLLRGPVRPYFGAGVSFSRLQEIPNFSINHLSNYGVVAEAGVELHILFLNIAPEIRYNGWGFRNFDGLVQSNRNQVAFLVGIGF
jgi:hypothetical protein